MLIGFFVGAYIGTFAGSWFPFLGGCLGAMMALIIKWDRELQPYKARERQRQAARRRSAKARATKIAGGSALAATATASQWQNDDSITVDDDIFSDSNNSMVMINPATGLPMLDGGIDIGGNFFGSSNDDWDSNISDSFSDDSSFSSFNDDSSFSSSDDW